MYEQDRPFGYGQDASPDPVLSISGEASPECSANESNINVAELTLSQRKAKITSLQEEIDELNKQVTPLFAEIASLAVSAQSSIEEPGQHKEYVDEIQKRLDELANISALIPAKKADIEKLEPSECCLRAAKEARKYCGECGTEMDDTGVITCTSCNARNHEDCNYCYNCRANLKEDVKKNLETPIGEVCPTCKEAIPPDYPGSFCNKCGTRYENTF